MTTYGRLADDAVRGVVPDTKNIKVPDLEPPALPEVAQIIPDFFGPGHPLWLPKWLLDRLEGVDEPLAREIVARAERRKHPTEGEVR